jgi:hypothetical protein
MRTLRATELCTPFENRLNNPLSQARAFSVHLRPAAARNPTEDKINRRYPLSAACSPLIRLGIHSLVQQQDARKNYIGIVNDAAEEESPAGRSARAQPWAMSYLVGRLAAVLKRSGKAAPERQISS